MKYIVIGLGTLGYNIARNLTINGYEVIGVDSVLSKVEQYKDDMSSTICMDAREYNTLSTLPIKDVDAVVVALGNDIGTAVEVVAYAKSLGAKKIFAKSNSLVESAIYTAIGITKIMNPSEHYAEICSYELSGIDIEGIYRVDEEYRIFETVVPAMFIDNMVREVNFKENFNIDLIAVKQRVEVKNFFGKPTYSYEVVRDMDGKYVFRESDVIVIFGTLKYLSEFKKSMK